MRHFLVFICLFAITTFARAEIIFSTPQGYVNDYAQMLSVEQSAKLNTTLKQFDQQTSNQVVVATFASLEGHPLETFSMKLAQQWKIGTKKHDNGVLLLIIRDDRKIRIETGYGLEGALTDAVSSSIIRNQIAPSFKKQDYAAGIEKGVTAILEAVKGEYKPENIAETSFYDSIWFWCSVGILLLLLFYPYVRQRGIKIPVIDFLFMILAMLLSNSQQEKTRRSGDDFINRGNQDNDSNDRGGFSGGGGKFGGGGASGDW